MQQPVRIETFMRQSAGIEIASPADPQHAAIATLAMQPPDQPGDGGSGQGAFFKILPFAREFMERPQHQPMTGQVCVDGCKAPGEGLRLPALKLSLGQILQKGYLPAQGDEPRRRFG